MSDELEDNLFKKPEDESEENGDEEEVQTPPPSPTILAKKDDKVAAPGLFSLAQVSIKLNELWSAARERVLGEDYWIPSDPYEVAYFPAELLTAHKTVYPEKDTDSALRVVQGSVKNEPGQPLHHVIFSFDVDGRKETLTIFRSSDIGVAMDLYRRCEESRALFTLIDKRKDIRKAIRDLTGKFQAHPLWRMIHIAIACNRIDVFTEEGFEFLKNNGYNIDEIINVASPEGQYPLMLAIETNQPSIVRFLLQKGASPAARDINGNNALHYAALASVQMLETVWQSEDAKPLLNSLNNDGDTPALLAIRNVNPRCLATLVGFGAELNLRAADKNPLFEAVTSKGAGSANKMIDVIKTLFDASPDLINARDDATGNNVLHAACYKMPLLGVLYLKNKELDLNAKNKAGQTALHIYTSRGDIGMVMTLASYDCDLNITNSSGNTALHIAVSKRYLDLTRLLLTLGADPNRTNNHKDTPRHLAAKLNETELLRSLIMCGAKRCPMGKSGCVSGCVNEHALRMISNNTNGGIVECQSPRSIAVITEIENPVKESANGQIKWNRIQDFEHEQIYKEMINKLESVVKTGERNSNVINLLTLDGGGIRGLVIIQLLLEVERVLGEPLFDYFDWCAGTSTGALVATGLAQGKTARECQRKYLRFKDLVFDSWVRPYNSSILEKFMQEDIGDTVLVSDIKWPRIMFTTTRADIFPVQLEFIRNYRLPLSDEENNELGYFEPTGTKLWKAVRRSSAAPTYFSSVDNKYIDGGIISNNPTLDLLAEVQLWNTLNKQRGLPNAVEVGCVLSLGTGAIPSIPMDPTNLELSGNPYSAAVAIKNLGILLVEQVTATEGAPVNRAGSWCITTRTPYFRLSAPLFKDIAMDARDDLDLAKMMWDCMEYSYKNKAYIERLCTLIKKIGKSWTRRHLFLPQKDTHHDMETQTSNPTTPDDDDADCSYKSTRSS